MHDPDSDLPRQGAFVRLTKDVRHGDGWTAYEGERGRVVYGPMALTYGVDLDDPPPGSEASEFTLWFDDEGEFLAAIEPADLGRDPAE